MAEEESGQLATLKQRKLPHQVLADVREVLSAYKSIVKINPEQDSGFLIKHFRKLLETDDEDPEAEAENQLDPDYDMLEKIRAVFRAFKTFCKWDVEGASAVFLKNLDRILLGNSFDYGLPLALTGSPSTEIEPSSCIIKQEAEEISEEYEDAEEEEEEEEIEFGAVTPYALEIEDGPLGGFHNYQDQDEDQMNHFDLSNSPFEIEEAVSFNHQMQQDNNDYDDGQVEGDEEINMGQMESNQIQTQSHNQIKFKSRPLTKVTIVKKPTYKPALQLPSSKILPDMNSGKIYPCSYCRRSFDRLRSKACHERYCAQKNKTTLVKYGQIDRINPIPTPIRAVQVKLKGPSASGLTTATNVSEAISYATSETLRKSGTNNKLSLVPGTDGLAKRYQCHLCTMKNFTSLVHLANHIRTHTQERPFICPHVGCGRQSSDSFNFRRHLRLHNKQKGQLVSIVRKTNLNMSLSAIKNSNNNNNNSRVMGQVAKKFQVARFSAP